MTTPILKITEAANGQVDQYLTYNEALRALESSTNNFYVVDMSSGDVTLTDAANVDPALNYIFSRNQVFRTTGNTVARVLTVPQTKRLFVVQNAGTFALTVKRGTTEISLNAALSAIFYSDGTADGLSAVSTGSGSGGDVVGPATSADNEIALFDGASGKSLKRGPVVGTAASANVVTSATDTTAGSVLTTGSAGLLSTSAPFTDWLSTSSGTTFTSSNTNGPIGVTGVRGWKMVVGNDIHAFASRLSEFYGLTAGPGNADNTTWVRFWTTGNTSANVQTMLGAANNSAIRSAISASSLPPYTLGTVPSASANTNLLIVITDLTGGREPCYSDGANWLRCSDKTIAS